MEFICSIYYKIFDSPIFEAISEGKTKKVEKLLVRKCHLFSRDRWKHTVLTAASSRGDLDLVIELIRLGLDVNDCKKGGCSPLIIAVMNMQTEVVRTLIDNGADVNLANSGLSNCGTTALMWAVNRNLFEIANIILKSGVNINAVNESQQTATMFAAANRTYSPEMFGILLKYNPDLSVKDWRGRDVYREVEDWSNNSGKHEMKELLIKAAGLTRRSTS